MGIDYVVVKRPLNPCCCVCTPSYHSSDLRVRAAYEGLTRICGPGSKILLLNRR
jgi:hypothetical protein